jgi:hypothetical protein
MNSATWDMIVTDFMDNTWKTMHHPSSRGHMGYETQTMGCIHLATPSY